KPAEAYRLVQEFGSSWSKWVTNTAKLQPIALETPLSIAKGLDYLREEVEEHPASLEQAWDAWTDVPYELGILKWDESIPPTREATRPATPEQAPTPEPTEAPPLTTEEEWWAKLSQAARDQLEKDYAREAGDSASPRTLHTWYH